MLCGSTGLAARTKHPESGQVRDEAKRADRDLASFPHASEDDFNDRDGGLSLSPEEIKGRTMWIVWSGGNDRFGDTLSDDTFGAFSLPKVIGFIRLVQPGDQQDDRQRSRP